MRRGWQRFETHARKSRGREQTVKGDFGKRAQKGKSRRRQPPFLRDFKQDGKGESGEESCGREARVSGLGRKGDPR